MGVKVRTNRLMDVTHAKWLGVRKNGLILERRVEQHVPCGQHAKPFRTIRFLPHKILMQLYPESPGSETRGRVHEIIGIIPSAGRETHAPRGGETLVLRLIVLILEPPKEVAETGIRPVLHTSEAQARSEGLDIL